MSVKEGGGGGEQEGAQLWSRRHGGSNGNDPWFVVWVLYTYCIWYGMNV